MYTYILYIYIRTHRCSIYIHAHTHTLLRSARWGGFKSKALTKALCT